MTPESASETAIKKYKHLFDVEDWLYNMVLTHNETEENEIDRDMTEDETEEDEEHLDTIFVNGLLYQSVYIAEKIHA